MQHVITDILGNPVCISPYHFYNNRYSLEIIKKVLTHPAYIIEVRGKALYFFSSAGEGRPVLLEVVLRDQGYFTEAMVTFPTKEYTMQLLSSGTLVHITDHV